MRPVTISIPDLQLSIQRASWVSVALSVVAGVLAYLNQNVLGFVQPWHTLVTAGLAVVAVLGVAPAAHGALTTFLHLPYQTALALSAALGSAAVGMATLAMDVTLRSVLVGVLTSLAGMIAGPVGTGSPQQSSQPLPAPVVVPRVVVAPPAPPPA